MPAQSTDSIPVILGPTASGKTSVGIELARMLNGEIISMDSRKVYSGLPIGTATPRGEWQDEAYIVQDIPHHLIAHLKPDEYYTAGHFAKDAGRLIERLRARGKTPILVGGTGFYFKALQQGLPTLPPRDPDYREKLADRIEKEGVEAVHAELAARDPEAAQDISSQDRQKIIRALEVFHKTGRPFSAWKNESRQPSKFRFTVMGIDFPKPLLEDRIKKRSRKMAEHGMIEETAAVVAQGYPTTCPALSSFGYREAVLVLEGKLPKEEFLPRLIKGTLAYAKRQRTWFRTQVQPAWFMCDESSKKEEIALKMKAFLESHPNDRLR